MANFSPLLPAGTLVVLALLLVMPTSYCEENAKEYAKAMERYIVHVEDMEFEYEEEADNLEDMKRERRNAIPIGSHGVWPNSTVPFEFRSNAFTASERRLILQAMEHWEKYTCIRFRPRNNTDIYAVNFVPGTPRVCESFIGRGRPFSQPQPISLGAGCFAFPVLVHEIGHALGFYHEHARPDRDEYITVINNNVLPGFLGAFATVPPSQSNSFNFGYDYASIMHYNPTVFSKANTQTIVTNQPDIYFGFAAELSPLDIAKANALYQCGPQDTHPPRSVVVPSEPHPSVPGNRACGSVTDVTGSGTIRSPGFPGHRNNQDCTFVIQAPEGSGFNIRFPRFQLQQSPGCTGDYVQIYLGISDAPNNLIHFNGYPGGRICAPVVAFLTFPLPWSTITFLYHTDNQNTGSARGLEISYSLIDIDECAPNGAGSRCHSCVNRRGSFDCGCNAGFYLSEPAKTCFDVNECAVETDGKKGGCDHTCINYAGSYECTCRSGFFLQTDGKSCRSSRPAFAPTDLPPGTSLPRIQTSPPATTRPTIRPTTAPPTTRATTAPPPTTAPPTTRPTTAPPTTRPTTAPPTTRPTTAPPTTRPTTAPPTTRPTTALPTTRPTTAHPNSRPTTAPPTSSTLSSRCGGGPSVLTSLSGSIQTVGWPNTAYPLNVECTWDIVCPAGSKIEIEFEDTFRIAGRMPTCTKDLVRVSDCNGAIEHGPFCHLTRPQPFETTCNAVKVTFDSNGARGSTRYGFKMNYQCTTPSTVAPPTTVPTTARLTTARPTTARPTTARPTTARPTTARPTTTTARPTTPRPTTAHPTTPRPTTARPTTQIPATESPTISALCGGGPEVRRDLQGSVETLGWSTESAYPINTFCRWRIECPSNQKVELTFSSRFRVAGQMPSCPKDQLMIHDCNRSVSHGPYCHLRAPQDRTSVCNAVEVEFDAGNGRGTTRNGFRLNYKCV